MSIRRIPRSAIACAETSWPLPTGPRASGATRQASGFAAWPGSPALAAACHENLLAPCVSAVRWRCWPDWTIPPRTVADDMLFFVERGRLWSDLAGTRIEAGPGDLLCWPRGVVHAAGWVADPLVVVAVHTTATVAGAMPLCTALGWPHRLATAGMPGVAAAFHDLARMWAQHPAGWRGRCDAALAVLVGTLIDHGHPSFAPDAGHAAGQWQRLQPALDAILANLAMPPSLPAMARRCGLSVVHFRRIFLGTVGCPPRTWICRQRIAEACRRLQAGDSIATVAAAVGFNDQAAFSTAFRRATGRPPGRWLQEGSP